MNLSLFGKPGVAYALLAVSVVVIVVLVVRKPAAPAAAKPAVAAAKAPQAPAPVEDSAVVPASEWSVVRTTLASSPSQSFAKASPDDGDQVSAVYARLFMWCLDLRKDLSPGDAMEVAYRWTEEGDLQIGTARLKSKKLGKEFRAYRFQAPGDQFASYWDQNGVEVPLQLKGGPLKSYDQITSLLKDRPTHKGMDFKTPVGTEVHVPFAGVVLRSNWNHGANGNCIEVQYPDGTLAKFLHLNENKVKPGDKVEADQVIALTGNTGHSTAPHLHYQLNQGDKVVDPVVYHGTTRRTLDAAGQAQLKVAAQQLDLLLAPRTASN